MILAIRTDKPQAELYLYKSSQMISFKKWQAHKSLAATIHICIKELLDSTEVSWEDIKGIIYFQGPGSFTGLRIGASVANTLAYSNNIPLANANGKAWVAEGIKALPDSKEAVALPKYGSEPHITTPKK